MTTPTAMATVLGLLSGWGVALGEADAEGVAEEVSGGLDVFAGSELLLLEEEDGWK